MNFEIVYNVSANFFLLVNTDAITKELNLINYFNPASEIIENNSSYYYKVNFFTIPCQTGQYFDQQKLKNFIKKKKQYFFRLTCIQCSNNQYNIDQTIKMCIVCPDNGDCSNGILKAKEGF